MGNFANKVHYPLLASFDDVEIVGICAFNEVRLRNTAKSSRSRKKIFMSQIRATIIRKC